MTVYYVNLQELLKFCIYSHTMHLVMGNFTMISIASLNWSFLVYVFIMMPKKNQFKTVINIRVKSQICMYIYMHIFLCMHKSLMYIYLMYIYTYMHRYMYIVRLSDRFAQAEYTRRKYCDSKHVLGLMACIVDLAGKGIYIYIYIYLHMHICISI